MINFQERESVVTPQEQSQAAGLPQGPVVNGGITPKHQWRGLLPSMASTPDHRGIIYIASFSNNISVKRTYLERFNQGWTSWQLENSLF